MKANLIIVLIFIIGTIECHNYQYASETNENSRTLMKDIHSLLPEHKSSKEKRKLRRGGGGRSSSRSSYSSSYSSKKTTTKKTKSTSNSYFNSKTGRTYQPLYVYYMPLNYYSAIGYYSTLYLLIYHNGYGYNFYYNKYGYYENSPNDV